jgi:NTE family protein
VANIENRHEKLSSNNKPDEDKQNEVNLFEVTSRSLETMQNIITRFKLASYNPDFLVEIPANACGLFDFHQANEMIELGYRRAAKIIDAKPEA